MSHVFRRQDDRLTQLRLNDFKLERDLQRLCEANLEALFGVTLLKSEFSLKNFRIDTLALDSETNAFVIIEYKRGTHFSVVDQGFAYLSALHSNPAELVLVCNEMVGTNYGKTDFDWRRSRVYFVAPSFTVYQRAIEFRSLPIDLWEVTQYGEDTVLLEHVGEEGEATAVVEEIGGSILTAESRKAAQYSVEDHLEGRPEEIRALFHQLRDGIMALADVDERAISVAVLYEADEGRFAEVIPQKKQILVHFNHYDRDPRGLEVRDFLEEGKGRYWAVGDYQVKVKPGDDIAPVLELIGYSYRRATEGQ